MDFRTWKRTRRRSEYVRTAAEWFLFVAVSVLLLFLLALQTIILLKGAVPLPRFAWSHLEEALEHEALLAEADGVAFVFPNRFRIDRLRITPIHEPDIAIDGGPVSIAFRLPFSFSGKNGVEAVSVRDVGWTRTEKASPDTASGILVQDLSFDVRRNADLWEIRGLRARTADTVALLKGPLPEPKPVVERVSLGNMLAEATEVFSKYKPLLEKVENGAMEIELDVKNIEARAFADAFLHSSGLRLTRPDARIVFPLSAPESSVEAFASAESAAFQNEFELDAEGISALLRFGTNEDGIDPVLRTGRLAAARATGFGEEAARLHLAFKQDGPKQTALKYFFNYDEKPARGEARLNLTTGTGNASLAAEINPTHLLRNPRLRDAGFGFDVSFDTPPETEARVEFGPNWAPSRAEAEVRSGRVRVDGVAMNTTRARAYWTPEAFHVPFLRLEYDDFAIEGAYWTDPRTREYRFSATGSIRPEHIAPWFRSWWDEWWARFAFPETPLQGSVVIRGVHNAEETDTGVFVAGGAFAENAYIRGVALDRVGANFEVSPGFARVLGATVERPEGKAHGNLVYRHGENEVRRADIELSSGINAQALGKLLGEESGEILDALSFASPPEIRLAGSLFEDRERNRLRIAARTGEPGGLAVRGFPLESLEFEGRLDGHELIVENVHAGFAGGVARGTGTYGTRPENDGNLTLQLELRDVAFGDAAEIVALYADWNGNESDRAEFRELGGRADLDFAGEGTMNDNGLLLAGDGTIHIREAELGQIRLLGLLSRLLERTPLRFTSLTLKELESSFQLGHEQIRFPAISLAGPNIALDARGEYLLQRGDLDFNVRVFPLRESPIPLVPQVLGRILTPLGHVFELKLTGTLAEPQWRLLVDPRNLMDESEPDSSLPMSPRDFRSGQ